MSNETPKANPKKTKSARRTLGYGLLVVAIIAACIGLALTRSGTPSSPYVEIGGKQFEVTVADTEAARTQGLSGRESLARNEGMLFVFDEPGQNCFWMKDMKFAIDMLWLDEVGTVVHLIEGATPETYPIQFCPEADALYVLEVNAGLAGNHGIEKGSRVKLFYR